MPSPAFPLSLALLNYPIGQEATFINIFTFYFFATGKVKIIIDLPYYDEL